MTEKWFAKRQSVTARTDEDAAMASKTEGPFVDRYEARAALITLIEREIAGWKRMGMDASRDERALVRVVEDGEDDVTEGNVRWHIVDVSAPHSAPAATYKVGDRLHFRPTPERAPFGTIIDEGDVTVVEVVDHGSATAHSPRFTYVVRAANGETQGTDDRELTEIAATAATIPLSAPADLATRMVEMGVAVGTGAIAAEVILANELADAIERFDSAGAAYYLQVPPVARTIRLIPATGGTWR